MRYAFLLMALALGISCADLTRPGVSPQYLRCASPVAAEAGGDTGLTGADQSLFGGAQRSSPYNCNSDPTICSQLGATFVCDKAQGCCQDQPPGYCNKSADCTTADKPVCNLSTNLCVACATGAMQAQGNQQCADWVTAQSDPLKRNLCINGLCGECLTNADCTRPGKSFCNQQTNTCGGCTQNSDCPGSNICKRDASLLSTGDDLTKIGDCADPTDVAYIDNSYFNCNVGDGTQLNPYCQVNAALAQAKPPSFIIVAGLGDASVHLYQPITVGTSGQRVAILGPGRDVMPYTTAQAVLNGVTVTNGAQVTLMNLAVTNHQAQPAVKCSGSSTLYMNNVLISDSAQPPQGGVYATLCSKVTIEKTKVAYAGGYGVYIVGGSGHRVINNAIIDSGSAAEQAGMRLSGGATGLFAFNTIAGNRLGGVVCDSIIPVTDSIVTNNGAGPQVSASCQSLRVVTTGITLDPSYMAATMAGDPRLIADPSNQCIDQGMPDANKTIKDDYFGSARPQGNGYDIGFQEVR